MKCFDFSTAVQALSGEALREPGKDGFTEVTFAKVAEMALLSDAQNDQPEGKLVRFRLALKIASASGPVELSIDEQKLLQDRSRQVCGTLIVGRIDEFLNSK